jgi:hypothetical protein
MIAAARAAALFVSPISTSENLTPAEVEAAVRQAIRTRGGSRVIAADVAFAYGDHPELAAARMRWARAVVEGLPRHATPRTRTISRCRDTLAAAA